MPATSGLDPPGPGAQLLTNGVGPVAPGTRIVWPRFFRSSGALVGKPRPVLVPFAICERGAMPEQEELLKRIEGLETAMAGQTAAMAGAQTTQAAAQVGTAATNAALQAGTWSTMVAGGVCLIAGLFLGMMVGRGHD